MTAPPIPRIGELLAIVEGSDLVSVADSPVAASVRELRRGYDRRVRLPRDLVEALARTTSLAQQEWVTARREADFGCFRPWLETIVELKRQEAACLAPSSGAPTAAPRPAGPEASLYDALLDDYEPGARSAELALLFTSLREQLVPLVQSIAEACARRTTDRGDAPLRRRFPLERQKVFAEAVAAAVGFDFQRGRLDVTAHPFCSGIGPGDTRLTTRYDSPSSAMRSSACSTRSATGCTNRGCPPSIRHAPGRGGLAGRARIAVPALGERRRPEPPVLDLLVSPRPQGLPEALHDVTSTGSFSRSIPSAQPDPRPGRRGDVQPAHHGAFRAGAGTHRRRPGDRGPAGRLEPEVPGGAGDHPLHRGRRLPAGHPLDAGLFGYFPTYTLGNVFAAQLFGRARGDLPGLDESFARGEFAELLSWLLDNIHRHGQRYRPGTLIKRTTGQPPGPAPLIASLKQKSHELQGL